MKRQRRLQPQALLFPRNVAQGDMVPGEIKREVVRVLADLLLETLDVARAEEGKDDEPEDHG
jgi:hypothetical protein